MTVRTRTQTLEDSFHDENDQNINKKTTLTLSEQTLDALTDRKNDLKQAIRARTHKQRVSLDDLLCLLLSDPEFLLEVIGNDGIRALGRLPTSEILLAIQQDLFCERFNISKEKIIRIRTVRVVRQ